MEQALKKQLRVWLTGFFLCAQRNKMLQEAFFLSHRCGRAVALWAWLYTPWALMVHAFVALAWWANRNRCALSQLEIQWFGSTFQGKTHAFVGRWHRWELYNALLGLGAGAGLASLHALSLGALFCRCRKKKCPLSCQIDKFCTSISETPKAYVAWCTHLASPKLV